MSLEIMPSCGNTRSQSQIYRVEDIGWAILSYQQLFSRFFSGSPTSVQQINGYRHPIQRLSRNDRLVRIWPRKERFGWVAGHGMRRGPFSELSTAQRWLGVLILACAAIY